VKIIHVPFCFYPDAVGGTEVYVASLVRLLKGEHGCEVLIAAPGAKSETYTHDNLRVRRFAVSPEAADVSELYGEGDELAAREFEKILEDERPDLVHLHAFTRGASLRLVRAARARSVPVVFTYHTPTVTCTRGTMMRWGRIPCDGEMLDQRCAACTLHGLGMNRVAAQTLSLMPSALRTLLTSTRKSGGVWTALRMRELVERRHGATRTLLAEVDHIVAVCDWVRDVLLRNGAPAEKITLCRQGIEHAALDEDARSKMEDDLLPADNRQPITDNYASRGVPKEFSAVRPLRLAYFGRLDPTKGVHVLIEALQLGKSLPVTLDIYGNSQGENGAAYAGRLQKLAIGDGRVEFKASVPSGKVIPTIRGYDAVVVPSQWLETGPLVVLEAFAAGVPVIGSSLGGIAELVKEGVTGFLVNGTGAEEWHNALRRLCDDSDQLAKLHRAIGRPPTMSAVAQTMIGLYQRLLEPLHASA
jgi:glycosyltransferase involved in cell wall biosynthesis